jgi:TonB family protein
MPSNTCHLCSPPFPVAPAAMAALFLVFGSAVNGQAPVSQPRPAAVAQDSAPKAAQSKQTPVLEVRAIKEDELKQQLQGKTFYLRGGYLENDLHFDRQGNLEGSSARASYTLSMVQIDRVSLSKHKLQLAGIRYGIHFLGGGPTEDAIAATDKVRITPKKKILKITIDRVEVVGKKKSKGSKSDGKGTPPAKNTLQPLDPNQSLAQSAAAGKTVKFADPEEPVVVNQAQANQFLKEALDHVFSQGLDDRMIASLPDFWRLYYQAADAKTNFKPADAAVLRQNAVDQKARLLTNFEPPSNDFAQAAGVAGVAQYHVVVGADGKPGEIAVGRPIGFGLDENAVAAIRNASFQPAIKDGKPVPVLLDLLVQFRIYSKRTGATGSAEGASATLSEPEATPLPGPYSANEAPTKQQ